VHPTPERVVLAEQAHSGQRQTAFGNCRQLPSNWHTWRLNSPMHRQWLIGFDTQALSVDCRTTDFPQRHSNRTPRLML